MRFKVFDSLFGNENESELSKTLFDMIQILEERVGILEEQYQNSLFDIKRLEEENIELTNEIYRLENSLDSRIDILAEHCRIIRDV
jgi:regulator of replication initiation timing